ncbi:hypothetical protein J6590_012515 [Homalodisca vitripennis]|nr:hypothetical protein J6590_012515 [Homalodisca vitripennis]
MLYELHYQNVHRKHYIRMVENWVKILFLEGAHNIEVPVDTVTVPPPCPAAPTALDVAAGTPYWPASAHTPRRLKLATRPACPRPRSLPHCYPTLNNDDGTICGTTSLVRWVGPLHSVCKNPNIAASVKSLRWAPTVVKPIFEPNHGFGNF